MVRRRSYRIVEARVAGYRTTGLGLPAVTIGRRYRRSCSLAHRAEIEEVRIERVSPLCRLAVGVWLADATRRRVPAR